MKLVCEEDGQKPSVGGVLQTQALSLLVLTSMDLTLCEDLQEQEATGRVRCGNDQVVGPGAKDMFVG